MFDLDRITQSVKYDSIDEQFFLNNCKKYGLSPNDLHRRFIQLRDNIEYEIVGMTKSGISVHVLVKHVKDMEFQTDHIYVVDIRQLLKQKIYKWSN